MGRVTTPSFIVELGLRVDDKQNRMLSQWFEFGRSIYNATVGTVLGRLQRMKESKEWREAVKMKKGKERNKRLGEIQSKYELTEFGLKKIANDHRKNSRRNDIGAHEAQCLGHNVWMALKQHFFAKGGLPRYKPAGKKLNSMAGTDNRDIMFKPELMSVVWRKQIFRVMYKETAYYKEAFADPQDPQKFKRVKFCRIVRRKINGRELWFVQICLEGYPPIRKEYAPREKVVGIDSSPSGVTYILEEEAGYAKAAPNVDMHEQELRRLQRAADRSRRATNPGNYNEDGTVKQGKLVWVVSKNCAKIYAQIAEVCRKRTATRKQDHNILANWLLQRAGTVKIEKVSYRSFQRGFFGKASQRSAMGLFVARLKRKAISIGSLVIELDARALKMSQYDPATNTYRKKLLRERWHRWGETDILVQRDVMSAFLAFHATDKGHDRELLLHKWPAVQEMLEGLGLIKRQPVDK